jgi:hypothetical protein
MIVAAAIKINDFVWILRPPQTHKHIVDFIKIRQTSTKAAGIGVRGVAIHTQKCGHLSKPLISPPGLLSEDLW